MILLRATKARLYKRNNMYINYLQQNLKWKFSNNGITNNSNINHKKNKIYRYSIQCFPSAFLAAKSEFSCTFCNDLHRVQISCSLSKQEKYMYFTMLHWSKNSNRKGEWLNNTDWYKLEKVHFCWQHLMKTNIDMSLTVNLIIKELR